MQREAWGEGSIFSVMQPLYCPELDELMDKRIDVLYSFQLDSGEKAKQWCQGKVIKILTEKTKPTVVVRWDSMPNVDGKENSIEETQQELPQRKWNKDVEGAWRLDNVSFVEESNVDESEKISNSEWNRMLRAVTRNRTKQNHQRLKAIVIKYNMIINGLLCSECIVQTYKHKDK
jgi:hypothetical protein